MTGWRNDGMVVCQTEPEMPEMLELLELKSRGTHGAIPINFALE